MFDVLLSVTCDSFSSDFLNTCALYRRSWTTPTLNQALYTGELPRGFVPCDVLKTVSFPLNCLNRFISIALINTARNRETCGLLLGTEEGGRYVVTTLLIPEQHATRDTCTIDDEELVMQFTEMRSLITLGWV